MHFNPPLYWLTSFMDNFFFLPSKLFYFMANPFSSRLKTPTLRSRYYVPTAQNIVAKPDPIFKFNLVGWLKNVIIKLK